MTMTLSIGESLRVLHIDERTRNYLVHVPANRDASQPMPVVLAFHGATSNARLMRSFCGLSEKAEQAGFVVVYPSGTGHGEKVLAWNGGACCGYAKSYNVDDVAYVRALLDDLATVVDIDPRRVYATGMSNGAMMVYRLAAECADRIAAIAPVAGPLGIDDPRPSRPAPVLHIHGTEDQFAPYHGGVGKRSAYGVPFRSVADTVAAWVRINGCDPTPTIIEEPTAVDDGTRIVRRIYRGDAEVILLTIEGGGHTWPGRPPFPETLGKSTRNLIANDVIWEFFQKHSLSEPEA
jgi:polyhydroxybutyrate depolymerase